MIAIERMLMSVQREDWVIAIERAGLALAVLARHIEPTTRSLPPRPACWSGGVMNVYWSGWGVMNVSSVLYVSLKRQEPIQLSQSQSPSSLCMDINSTEPEPKWMNSMPLCLWGVQTGLTFNQGRGAVMRAASRRAQRAGIKLSHLNMKSSLPRSKTLVWPIG